MVEYAFRDGARFQKGARTSTEVAQIVGDHLELLRSRGRLTPEAVIDDARNPNSPLHPFFEWDDGEAARQHRLAQARGLIRCIVVRYRETTDGGPKTINAFVSVQRDDGRAYVSTAAVMTEPELRRQTLRKAWDQWQAFKARYHDLAEFAQLFAAAEEIERALPPLLDEAA